MRLLLKEANNEETERQLMGGRRLSINLSGRGCSDDLRSVYDVWKLHFHDYSDPSGE